MMLNRSGGVPRSKLKSSKYKYFLLNYYLSVWREFNIVCLDNGQSTSSKPTSLVANVPSTHRPTKPKNTSGRLINALPLKNKNISNNLSSKA